MRHSSVISNGARNLYLFSVVAFTGLLIACASGSSMPPKGPPPRPPNTLPIETRVITLEEARQQASFHFFVPTYLPSGFRIVTVTRWDTPTVIPSDTQFYVEYMGPVATGGASPAFLTLSEEYWPPQPAIPIPAPPPELTRPPQVSVHGVSVYVDKNTFGPSWVTPEAPDERYLALHWAEKNVFITLGGSLSLDELTKIAESLQ